MQAGTLSCFNTGTDFPMAWHCWLCWIAKAALPPNIFTKTLSTTSNIKIEIMTR